MKKVLRVRISECILAKDSERLKSSGLGSCIGLVIWDPQKKIGGMAHILLPSSSNSRPPKRSAKYASSAVALLIQELKSAGCRPRNLVAKIAGGANMFPQKFNTACGELGINIGDRNTAAVKQELAKKKIRLVSEDLGGETGRTIEFNPKTGELCIYKSSGEVIVI